jgi:hypothetical protein
MASESFKNKRASAPNRQYKFRRCVVCGNHNRVGNQTCFKCGAPMQHKAVKTAARQRLDKESYREERERLIARLDLQMRGRRLPPAAPEHRFHPTRQWRFDRAYPEIRLAIEVEGGLRTVGEDGQRGGRHNRPDGYIEDRRKYTAAAVLGWRVVYVTIESLQDNSAVDAIVEILKQEKMRVEGVPEEINAFSALLHSMLD